MRYLVTGGAGFIGSALVRLLVQGGHDVVNIDSLTYAASLSSLDPVADSPRYRFIKADIRDQEAVRSAIEGFRPDRLVHLAAETHVDRSIDHPTDFVETNVLGTAVLLVEAARFVRSLPDEADFRFVHVSTDEVFGSLGTVGAFSPDTPYQPRSPYAASKAGADHLVRAWHETFDFPAIITNCSNNYGPYQFPEKLIPRMLIRALRGESLPIYGTGANVREWIHVNDHARALELVAEAGEIGATYLVGSGHEMTNLDLVGRIARRLDEIAPGPVPYEERIEFVRDRPGHDLRYSIDSSRIRTELGWSPLVEFEEGIRDTVDWYVRRVDWWEPILEDRYQGQRLGIGEDGQQ
jgi:dTDP-glucose 4,6-dehydratase